jgi:predicted PurR-regulated permease PerM
MITVFIFIIIFVFIILGGLSIWTMQVRVETLTNLFSELENKVSQLKNQVDDGEAVIIENFKIVNRQLKKMEGEIKNAKRPQYKTKEAVKAARIENRRQSE